MDLKDFLRDVFPEKDDERFSRMFDNLKDLGFDSVSDLKEFDEEAAKELNSFTRIEIKKLTSYLTNFEFETLDEILRNIFGSQNIDRIKEIKTSLNQHSIRTRRDFFDIVKMGAQEFLSENELQKIEGFLEEYNGEHYYKMVTGKQFHRSDLVPCLFEIFRGSDSKRISEIEDILNGQGITATKDLVYIDTKKLKKEKFLSEVEVSKIDSFLEQNYKEQLVDKQSKDLKHILNEIFYGTSEKRLEDIENMLQEEEIYSGRDLSIIDLNSSHMKQSLTDAEMLKFEIYLKRTNFEQYEKIMEDRHLEKSRENLKEVLKEVFMGTPEQRMEEIEIILKEEQIYLGSDLMVIDTNDLREKSTSNNCLSNIEILKIEEYIRKNNKERYDEIKTVAMANNERKMYLLKATDEVELFKSKEEAKLKFKILNAQEDQKMIKFKSQDDIKLREEEIEVEKAKAKEKMNRYIIEMQKKKLSDAKAKDKMDKKMFDLKIQREERDIKMREDLIKEKIMMQKEKEVKEEKLNAALEMQKCLTQRMLKEQRCRSLADEKKYLMDDVKELERECTDLKKLMIEMKEKKGFLGLFKSSEADKKKLSDEYEEMNKKLNSKRSRITQIDNDLQAQATNI